MAGLAFRHQPQSMKNRSIAHENDEVVINLNRVDENEEFDIESFTATPLVKYSDDVDVKMISHAYYVNQQYHPQNNTQKQQLYYTKGECYIYRKIGHSNGCPKTKRCIIYDTEPNEVVALSSKPRINKYYVECKKPIKGFVYLPDDNFDENDNKNISPDEDIDMDIENNDMNDKSIKSLNYDKSINRTQTSTRDYSQG